MINEKVVTITLNPAIDRKVIFKDFTLNSVNKINDYQDTIGGKGINVALVLKQFGIDVFTTGILGIENEKVFINELTNSEIANDFIKVAGATRTNIKITSANDNVTDINFKGFSCTTNDIAMVIDKALAENTQYIVLAGSLPNSIKDDGYYYMLNAFNKAGKKVLLDTSGLALKQAIKASPYFIKPNIDELEELVEQKLVNEDAILSAALKLQKEYKIANIVVSMGEKGALMICNDSYIKTIPPAQEVVSTVGAGDSFVAGWLMAKLKRMSELDGMKFATALSAHSVTHLGVGKHKNLQDLQSIIHQVDAKEIYF